MAHELTERLKGKNVPSLFHAFDPEQGIPAGRDWERQLRGCNAMIARCSQHFHASQWCLSEIAIAFFGRDEAIQLIRPVEDGHAPRRAVLRIDRASKLCSPDVVDTRHWR